MKVAYALLSSVSAIVFLAVPATARAQSTPRETEAGVTLSAGGAAETDPTSANADAAIVVTGTRLNSAATAPTPVIATSAEQLQNTSPKLLSAALG